MKFSIMSIIFMLILSCSEKNYSTKTKNGVMITKNKNIPNSPKTELKLKKLYSINTEEMKTNFDRNGKLYEFDSTGSLFIFDIYDCKIYKYDREGNLVTSFGSRGEGPGEFISPVQINIENDVIRILDYSKKCFVLFDKEGKFLENQEIPVPMSTRFLASDEGYLYKTMGWLKKDNRNQYITKLEVLDKDFKSINTLYEYSYFEGDKFLFNRKSHSNVCMENSKIILPESDENIFKINIYDSRGNKTAEINKDHIKIALTDEDKEYYKKFKERTKSDFYINSLLPVKYCELDKYGNIWASVNYDREKYPVKSGKLVYDVFNSDGIYLNRVVTESGLYLSFINDKYLSYDRENKIFTVYEYEVTSIDL